jgi:myo-inositol-1-phosphate synthase
MTATTNIETEAFVVDSPNAPFKLTPIILDEMRGDEFLIEMKYTGICHTVSGYIFPSSRGTNQLRQATATSLKYVPVFYPPRVILNDKTLIPGN